MWLLLYVTDYKEERKKGKKKTTWKRDLMRQIPTWSDVQFRARGCLYIVRTSLSKCMCVCDCVCLCVCVCSLVDPFRPVCEWQRGLCKEPQRGRSGQSDRRSGQQSVTLNTSPWHCADTLCHRPTHCLSTLFTHTRTHARTARARRVCAAVCQHTRRWPPLCVCVSMRATERDKNIKRGGEGVCLPEKLPRSHEKWVGSCLPSKLNFKKRLILTFFLWYWTLIGKPGTGNQMWTSQQHQKTHPSSDFWQKNKKRRSSACCSKYLLLK